MDIPTIKQSIANWHNVLNNNAKLIEYFGQGNSFLYNFTTTMGVGSSHVHAYPAVKNGQLIFLMIPSKYDTPAYAATINNYVTECDVTTMLRDDRIPKKEATKRMTAWNNNYASWVPMQTATSAGMFQAFAIKVEDFEPNADANRKINFGLIFNPALPQQYTADLIVTNVEMTATYYDDMAQAVPPFGATAAQSSFYLLQL
jgi:hypothetical protein